MPDLSFPENFLWGSATSSYQIEGRNENNDWFLWEQKKKVPFSCKDAVKSYDRFEEDFDLAKTLGHNCHRLSFEWSRIQPKKNSFDSNQIEHYRKVISALLKRNITPIVTLHHFTNPLWFYNEGCWLSPNACGYFVEYVKRVVEEFSGLVNYWITVNEPLVYIYNSYLKGIWPPGKTSMREALLVFENIKRAHLKAYSVIHQYCPDARVSIAKHLRVFSPCFRFNLGQNSIIAILRNRMFNLKILNFFVKNKALDFIGVNYYAKDFVNFSFSNIFGKECFREHHLLRKNSLGWYIEPRGIFDILMRLKQFGLPILITENGTTEEKDSLYEDYLKEHLFYVAKALQKGVNVIGYLWWSLIDNFEWDKGFSAKFGLVGVDKDLNRSIKPFARIYKDICTKNRLEYV